MTNKLINSLLLSMMALCSQAQIPTPDHEKLKDGELTIQPITHASLVLTYHKKNIYIDPTGGAVAYTGLGAPDLILITDIHGDHMDPKTIAAIDSGLVTIVVPQAVADKLPASMDKAKLIILKNGDSAKIMGVTITAVPMYNLPETPEAFHTKGRGNGYILSMGGKNIYISGDTEDTPEMRALKNIDIAFVCMNLPYTMDVTQASQGVLAFKPKVIYPYHYRGQDVNQFKTLVNAGDPNIEVRLRNWYPGK